MIFASTAINPFGCRFAGHFKGDSSASTSSAETYTDESIAAQNSTVLRDGSSMTSQSGVFSGGGDITIESTDAAVIDSALKHATGTANRALDVTGAVALAGIQSQTAAQKDALAFGTAALNSNSALSLAALDYSNQGQKATLDFANKTISQAANAFQSAAAGESGQLTDTIGSTLKVGALAAAVVGAIYFSKKRA